MSNEQEPDGIHSPAEVCVIDGQDIGDGRQWSAHWGGEHRVVIEAWTCSPSCTEAYHEQTGTTDCCLGWTR